MIKLYGCHDIAELQEKLEAALEARERFGELLDKVRRCTFCGKAFATIFRNKRICSRQCRLAAQRKNKLDWYHARRLNK